MPLLNVGASRRSFATGLGRNGIEFSRKPTNELRELSLASANLLQLFDQPAALLIALIEEPNKNEPDPVLPIA